MQLIIPTGNNQVAVIPILSGRAVFDGNYIRFMTERGVIASFSLPTMELQPGPHKMLVWDENVVTEVESNNEAPKIVDLSAARETERRKKAQLNNDEFSQEKQ